VVVSAAAAVVSGVVPDAPHALAAMSRTSIREIAERERFMKILLII
jgi:hypothetical protein